MQNTEKVKIGNAFLILFCLNAQKYKKRLDLCIISICAISIYTHALLNHIDLIIWNNININVNLRSRLPLGSTKKNIFR